MAASIPKEQSFAFDVNQILGYYQRNGVKHTEPMGRNSRHFSPTPYFSSASGHHQPQSSMKSHPGLTQGHAPLPRRPRQGKNTSPSPSGSFTPTSHPSSGTSTTPTSAVFPAMADQVMSAVPSSASDTSVNDNNASTLSDPFGTPGSATITNSGMPPSPAETDMSFSSNAYQNPFSSSLWGLPTSMDSDEWMLYMQNGGADVQSGMDLSSESARSTPRLKTANEMFGPIPDLTSNAFMDTNNVSMNMGNMNNSNIALNSKSHPLSQSLTSNDLIGGLDHTAVRSPSNSSGSGATGTILAPTSFSGAASSPTALVTSSIPSENLHQGALLPYQQHPMGNNSYMTTSAPQQQQQEQQQPQPSEFDFLLGGADSLGIQQHQLQQQQQQLQLLQQQQF